MDISEFLGCHLLRQMSSQWGSKKLLQGLVPHELTAYLSIFNHFKINELWPHCQTHVNQIILDCNSLELSFTIFKAFARILLIVNPSLSQTLLTFLLCVRETWMTQLIWQFLCERLPSFNPDGFWYLYAWSCSLCYKGLPFAWDLSLENSADSYLFFRLALFHCVLLLFPLLITFFVFVHGFWILFHLT